MCLEDWQRPAYIPVQRSDETPPSSLCPRRGLPPPEPASTWRHPPPAGTCHKRRLLDLLPRQTPYSFRATAPVTNSLESSIGVLRASFTSAAFEAHKILDRYRRSPIAIHQVEGLSFGGSRHGRPGAIGSLAGNVSSSDSSRKSSWSCSEVSVSLGLLVASAALIISIPLMLGPTNLASLTALRH